VTGTPAVRSSIAAATPAGPPPITATVTAFSFSGTR
jgi:hypothetical protein